MPDFSKILKSSPDPQHLVNFQEADAKRAQEYANKGIIYGSAVWTELDCLYDQLLEEFEQGQTVEQAIANTEKLGYDMGAFYL